MEEGLLGGKFEEGCSGRRGAFSRGPLAAAGGRGSDRELTNLAGATGTWARRTSTSTSHSTSTKTGLLPRSRPPVPPAVPPMPPLATLQRSKLLLAAPPAYSIPRGAWRCRGRACGRGWTVARDSVSAAHAWKLAAAAAAAATVTAATRRQARHHCYSRRRKSGFPDPSRQIWVPFFLGRAPPPYH